MTDSKYIWVVGLAPFFFLAKVQFLVFFLIQKEVWPYRYAHNVLLVKLIINIWVRGSNFNCLSVNHGYTDRHTIRIL